MYLELDAKRLHRDGVLESEDQPAEATVEDAISDVLSETQAKGDPRLIDCVHFEHCAHETFSEEFCVPSKGNAKPKSAKRAKDEGDIEREDLEYLCRTILTQEERKGYWEIQPDIWGDRPLVLFNFESVVFVVHCEDKKLVRLVTQVSPFLLQFKAVSQLT